MQCTIKARLFGRRGINVGRAIPGGNENGPNMFFTVKIVADPSRAGSINVVRYWDNLEHMVSYRINHLRADTLPWSIALELEPVG